ASARRMGRMESLCIAITVGGRMRKVDPTAGLRSAVGGSSIGEEAEGVALAERGGDGAAEGPDGLRLVEPHVLVELAREDGGEVVALELGVRPVHHADGALGAGVPALAARGA